MEMDEEERQLRQAALQNMQTILQARQRAEQEVLRTKEALEEETRILELLNQTGATLASNLDLASLVQAVTDAQVFPAGSAAEGLGLVTSHRPDLIISDIGMPERDGYEFIRDVRRLPATEGGKTPAIALTGFARSEDRTRAMLAGYQVHASKPVAPLELMATIKSLAANSRS